MPNQPQTPKILSQDLGQSQSQNLISPIRIDKIEHPDKPEGFYKQIILEAISIVSAFFVGYAYFEFLKGSWSLFTVIGAVFVFTVLLTLETLFGDKIWRRIGILVAEVIALFLPFYAFDLRILGVAAAIIFLFFWAGYLQSRGEMSHSTTIRFFKSTHGVVAKTVTATLLAAIILYLPMVSAGAIFISETGFDGFFNWAAGLVGNFYPTLSLTGSFDEFAQSVAKEGLANNSTFQTMSATEQSAAISAAATEIETNLSKSIGVTSPASSSMSNVAYDAIEHLLQGWRDRFSVWFTAGWGITLFLILRSIGVIMVWIGQFLTMIVYELLLATGVIRIVEEAQTKEKIEF